MRSSRLICYIALVGLLLALGVTTYAERSAGTPGRADPDTRPSTGAGAQGNSERPRTGLVGFMTAPTTGGTGLLNMSAACAKVYEGSRMCTVAEIHQTTGIPELPGGFEYAWVEPGEREDHPATVLSPDSWMAGTTGNTTDCTGWTSTGSYDRGMAISICSECYGGFFLVPCSEQLAIACCIPQSEPTR